MSEPDDRDLVISALSDDLHSAREAVRQLEAFVVVLQEDREVYRLLVQTAFDALRDLTVRYDRKRAEAAQVNDAYRHLREMLVLQSTTDDEHAMV